MIPVGKYLPPLTPTRCHNDSLCVVPCVPVYTSAGAPVSAPACVLPLQLQLASLINNASFILKSGLTLAAFCLLPGARVRMYRLKNKDISFLNKKKEKKKHPWKEIKNFPLMAAPLPPTKFRLIA